MIPFLEVEFDRKKYEKVKTGLKTAIFGNPSKALKPNIHENWEMRDSNKFGNWPHGSILHPASYWIRFWKKYPAENHVTLKPHKNGWTVWYAKKNTWIGGYCIGGVYSFQDAAELAGRVMEQYENQEYEGVDPRNVLSKKLESTTGESE